MSTTLTKSECCTDYEQPQFTLPENTHDLFYWLDEQPNFVSREVETRVRTGMNGRTRYRNKTTTQTFYLNPDYEIDTRACHDTQNEVASAWEDMKFPMHNWDTVEGVTGAHIYSWSSTSAPRTRFGRVRRGGNNNRGSTINYQAVQHPDGHGVIQHYDTIAAIRTKAGFTLVNEQDYGTGFAVMTRPDDWKYELPLSGIQDILDDKPETVFDIEAITRDMTNIRYTTTQDPIGGHRIVTGVRPARNDRQVTLVDLSSGAAVVLLYDSTANNRDERKCGFYITPKERSMITGAADALALLRPIDVNQAIERGLEVIPSDEYAGDGASFDGTQLGDAIIRQGEWYLIPMPDDFEPDAPIYKPLPVANRDSDWDLSPVEDDIPDEHDIMDVDTLEGTLPPECPECGYSPLEIDAELPVVTCHDCLYSAAYDEDTYNELADEKFRGWVQSTYGDLYDMALDVLDSHRPRDMAVTEDPDALYVRGTFRHIDNEHQMLNMDERWHLAAENTRDVVVFDLGTEGSGGTARWE